MSHCQLSLLMLSLLYMWLVSQLVNKQICPRLGTVGEEPQHGFGVAGPPEVGPCKTEVLTIHHCERIVQAHMD